MQQIIKLLFGILFLIIGYFIGGYLAQITNEELRAGQKWFKLIIIVCLIGAVLSLVFKNDVLLFSFLFMMVVANRSLRK